MVSLQISSREIDNPSAYSTLIKNTKEHLVADAPLHIFIAIYVLSASVLAFSLGATERFVPFNYMAAWTTSLLQACVIAFGSMAVCQVRRTGLRTGLRQVASALLLRWKYKFLPGLCLCISMSVFFGTFTSIKNMMPLMVPFWCDKLLADIGALLHGGRSPWFLLQPFLGYPIVTRAIEFLYAPVWFLLLTGFPVLVATVTTSGNLQRRYLIAMMLCFVLLGNVAALVAMSAGPIYYGAVTGDASRYAAISSYIQSGSGSQYSAWDLQQYLWDCWRYGAVELGTGISAFPSLHVSMATLFALTAGQIDRRLGATFGLYLAIILLGSVHLGWHYAVDGYFSIAATWLIWKLAGRLAALSRCWGQLPPSGQAPVPTSWDGIAQPT